MMLFISDEYRNIYKFDIKLSNLLSIYIFQDQRLNMQQQIKMMVIKLIYYGIQTKIDVDPKYTLKTLKQNFLYYQYQSKCNHYFFKYFQQNNHTISDENICIQKLANLSLELYLDKLIQIEFTKKFLVDLMNINNLFSIDIQIDVKPLTIQEIQTCENLYEILALSLILQNPLILNGFNQNIVIEQNRLKFLLEKLNLKISNQVLIEYGAYYNMQYKQLQIQRQFIVKEIQKLSNVNILDWVIELDKINDKSFQQINKISKKQWLLNMMSRINKLRSAINLNKTLINLQYSKNFNASINLINKFCLSEYYKQQQKYQINKLTYQLVKNQVFHGEITLTTEQISSLKNNPFCKIQNLSKKDINFCIRQIRRSKQRKKYSSIHATNSITFLVMHNYIFQNLDFRKIVIQNADLSQGNFTKINFSDSRLQNCNVQGTIFQGCEFAGVYFKNLQSSEFMLKFSNEYYHQYKKFVVNKGYLYILYNRSISIVSITNKKIIKRVMLTMTFNYISDFKAIDNYFFIVSYQTIYIFNQYGKKIMEVKNYQNHFKIFSQNTIMQIKKNACFMTNFQTFQSTSYQFDWILELKIYNILEYEGIIYIANKNEIIKYNKSKKAIGFPDRINAFLIQDNKIYCVANRILYIYDLIQDKLEDFIRLGLEKEITRINNFQLFQNRYLNFGVTEKQLIVDLKFRKVYHFLINPLHVLNNQTYHIQNNNQHIKFWEVNLNEINQYIQKNIQKSQVNDMVFVSNSKVVYKSSNDVQKQLRISQNNTLPPKILYNKELKILVVMDQFYIYIVDINNQQNLSVKNKYINYNRKSDKKKHQANNAFNLKNLNLLNFDNNRNLHIIFENSVIMFKYPGYETPYFFELVCRSWSGQIFFIGESSLDFLALQTSNNKQLKILNNKYEVKYYYDSYFANKSRKKYQHYDSLSKTYTIQTNQVKVKFHFIVQNYLFYELLCSLRSYHIFQKQILYLSTKNQMIIILNIQKNDEITIKIQKSFKFKEIKIIKNLVYCVGNNIDNNNKDFVLQVYDPFKVNCLTKLKLKQINFEIYSITIFQQNIFIANMDREVYCFEMTKSLQKVNLIKLKFRGNIKQVAFYNKNFIFLDHFANYYVYDQKLTTKVFEKCQKKRIVHFNGVTNNQKFIYQFSSFCLEIFDCENFVIHTYQLPHHSIISNLKIDDTGEYAIVYYKKILIVIINLKSNKIVKKIIGEDFRCIQIDKQGHIYTIDAADKQNARINFYKESFYKTTEIIQPEDLEEIIYKQKLSNVQLIEISRKQKNNRIYVWDCIVDSNQKFELKHF